MTREFKTKITEMLGIQYPILCGGMQWVSRADFVSHVCNAGAIGFITAETFETPEDLRQEIRKMRTLTDKPFGVNISMLPELPLSDRTQQFCEIVCEEGVKFVETAGRSPEALIPMLKQSGVKIIHKLTNIRHAKKAQKLGVDAVTILGYGSGGHIGMDDVALFILLPIAVKELDIPVIAGGSVATGAGLLGALAMGAEAVLMGTAFFATEESPIHPNIKRKVINAREVDTTLVMRSILNPLRVVKNELSNKILAMEAKGATLEEIVSELAGGKGKLAYDNGDTEISPIAGGQVVGLVNEIKPVKKVIDDIIAEASQLMERLESIAGK
ncbi:nitronate monooxygenase [bacterium]|nr:nitronate monooxygenase [bacterium]